MSFDIFSELLIQQIHKNQECIISLSISFTRNKKKDVLTWHRKHERKIWHWNEQIYVSYGIYFLLHIQPHIRILNNTTWWLIGNISRYSINLNERDLSSNTYSTLVMNQMLVRFYWKRRSLFLYHFKTDYFFLTRFNNTL